jgi:hypothetical protein
MISSSAKVLKVACCNTFALYVRPIFSVGQNTSDAADEPCFFAENSYPRTSKHHVLSFVIIVFFQGKTTLFMSVQ